MKLRVRKLLGISVFLSILLSSSAFAFADVAQTNPYQKAIFELRDRGVINGFPDGSFQPDKNISRVAALKIFIRLFAEAEFTAYSKNILPINFPDTHDSQWYYPYASFAYHNQIMTGFEDGTFRPGAEITSAEILAIANRFLTPSGADQATQNTTEPAESSTSTTTASEPWYQEYQNWAIRNGLLLKANDGSLTITKPTPRDQVTDLLFRISLLESVLTTESANTAASSPNATDSNTLTAIQEALRYNWPTKTVGAIAIKTPYFWSTQDLDSGFTSYIRDPFYSQVFISTIYPLSASITVETFANNGTPPQELSASLQREFADFYGDNQVQAFVELNHPIPRLIIKIPTYGRMDAYYFTDSEVYALHGRYGQGAKAEQFELVLASIINSVTYAEEGLEITPNPASELFTTSSTETDTNEPSLRIQEALLKPQAAAEVLGLFAELELISTDELGIGTGPVDYYYTLELDITLKVERNSDTLLDLMNGRTDKF